MNNLNSILIEGNLVREPQTMTTTNGTLVCNLTIASNRFYKNNSGYDKEVCYFEVQTFGKLAESCSSKGTKGRGVRVVGRLKQERWDGKDGKPRSRVIIVAEHCEFRADSKKNKSVDAETETVEIPEMAESLVPSF